MFDPDAGIPRVNQRMLCLRACLIAGIHRALGRAYLVTPPMPPNLVF